ncbi:MAG: hypothetical protein Ct9H300mP8_07330 [Gammaproteobacteria bacterium]|nr:MAG: hypothetical protein Ct9H300mP8_07330 [Gammaproteobacteria bacterium]
MQIEQIWPGNAYRNFNYVLACGETGKAFPIDPFDHEKCLARARDRDGKSLRFLTPTSTAITPVVTGNGGCDRCQDSRPSKRRIQNTWYGYRTRSRRHRKVGRALSYSRLIRPVTP